MLFASNSNFLNFLIPCYIFNVFLTVLLVFNKDILFYKLFQCTTFEHKFLHKHFRNPPWRDGSTASCVLILNSTLYAANVGDTKVKGFS